MPRADVRPRFLLTITGIAGTLTWRGQSVRAKWSIRVNRAGEARVRFSPVRITSATAFLLEVAAAKGRFSPWAAVDGLAPDGRRITSHRLYLNARDTKTSLHGLTRVTVSGTADRLTLEWLRTPKTSRGLRVSYGVCGLQGFGVQTVLTRAGRLELAGPPRLSNFDQVEGLLDITATGRTRKLADWLSRCDEQAARVLDIISLAEGRSIGWSLRHLIRADRILVTELYGPHRTGGVGDGVGHFLDLQPWLDLAVGTYSEAVIRRTGVREAIRWLVGATPQLELQLIGAATALEHLVSRYVRTHGSRRIVAVRTFAALHARIDRIFEDAVARARREGASTRQKSLTKVRQRVPSLNEPSMLVRLEAMLQSYAVPLAGIEADIAHALRARHRVVHSGSYSGAYSFEELYGHVAVLRELLKRVILRLLRFKGRYESFLNGPESLMFPNQ